MILWVGASGLNGVSQVNTVSLLSARQHFWGLAACRLGDSGDDWAKGLSSSCRIAHACSHGGWAGSQERVQGKVQGTWTQGVEQTHTLSVLPHSVGQTRQNVSPYSKSEEMYSSSSCQEMQSQVQTDIEKGKRNDVWPLNNLPHKTNIWEVQPEIFEFFFLHLVLASEESKSQKCVFENRSS